MRQPLEEEIAALLAAGRERDHNLKDAESRVRAARAEFDAEQVASPLIPTLFPYLTT